jgi:transcription antitermination factor NusG
MPMVSVASELRITGSRAKAAVIQPEAPKDAWFAVYTVPRHEKVVHARLMAKQIQSFLPLYTIERRWKNGVRREVQFPLFPEYVFVSLRARDRLSVLQTSGVAYIVGSRSSPLPLDDYVIYALQVGDLSASLVPHPFVYTSNMSEMASGPLRGVRGYQESDGGDPVFVVNVELIQRSFAIRMKTICAGTNRSVPEVSLPRFTEEPYHLYPSP